MDDRSLETSEPPRSLRTNLQRGIKDHRRRRLRRSSSSSSLPERGRVIRRRYQWNSVITNSRKNTPATVKPSIIPVAWPCDGSRITIFVLVFLLSRRRKARLRRCMRACVCECARVTDTLRMGDERDTAIRYDDGTRDEGTVGRDGQAMWPLAATDSHSQRSFSFLLSNRFCGDGWVIASTIPITPSWGFPASHIYILLFLSFLSL